MMMVIMDAEPMADQPGCKTPAALHSETILIMPQAASATSSPQRLMQLDLIRAAAILLVLVNHTPFLDISSTGQKQLAFLTPLFRMGEVGVPLFFVLSGFLIGGLLLNETTRTRSLAPGRFLIRRGFKIYPPFYLTILAYAGYLHFFEGSLNLERFAREIFFLQNYGLGGLIDVSWSLAVEEHFYFLFAFIATWLVRRQQHKADESGQAFALRVFKPVAVLALILMGACWIWRCAAFLPMGDREIAAISPTPQTHFRIDALFAGAALAWLWFSGWNPRVLSHAWTRLPLLLLAMGTLALNAIPSSHLSLQFKKTHYLLMLTLAAAALIWLSLRWKPGENPLWSVLAAIGRHSYCIYLVHVPLFRLLNKVIADRFDGWHGLAHAAIAWTAAVLAGMVMTRLVETPALRLRDRWFPPSGLKMS
jgi:peptidoglycan/LPS O-acetylase OafA/YrhL